LLCEVIEPRAEEILNFIIYILSLVQVISSFNSYQFFG
jgi:hypothetical protein